jgi:hypothetical protein
VGVSTLHLQGLPDLDTPGYGFSDLDDMKVSLIPWSWTL